MVKKYIYIYIFLYIKKPVRLNLHQMTNSYLSICDVPIGKVFAHHFYQFSATTCWKTRRKKKDGIYLLLSRKKNCLPFKSVKRQIVVVFCQFKVVLSQFLRLCCKNIWECAWEFFSIIWCLLDDLMNWFSFSSLDLLLSNALWTIF